MTLEDRSQAMADKMAKQLRLRAGTLPDVAKKAGRKLPARHRAEAHQIAQAALLAGHPKLSRQVDQNAVAKAERSLGKFLDARNPRAERMGRFLDWLAAVAFVAVLIVLSVFFILLSRGYFE